jgi:hypothetical protein
VVGPCGELQFSQILRVQLTYEHASWTAWHRGQGTWHRTHQGQLGARHRAQGTPGTAWHTAHQGTAQGTRHCLAQCSRAESTTGQGSGHMAHLSTHHSLAHGTPEQGSRHRAQSSEKGVLIHTSEWNCKVLKSRNMQVALAHRAVVRNHLSDLDAVDFLIYPQALLCICHNISDIEGCQIVPVDNTWWPMSTTSREDGASAHVGKWQLTCATLPHNGNMQVATRKWHIRHLATVIMATSKWQQQQQQMTTEDSMGAHGRPTRKRTPFTKKFKEGFTYILYDTIASWTRNKIIALHNFAHISSSRFPTRNMTPFSPVAIVKRWSGSPLPLKPMPSHNLSSCIHSQIKEVAMSDSKHFCTSSFWCMFTHAIQTFELARMETYVN